MSTPTKKTAIKKAKAASKTLKPKNALAAKATSAIKPISVTPLDSATPLANAAKAEIVNPPQPVVMGPAIRKKEIIELAVARSGLKKRDVKPIIDHLLAVMGEAMAEGRELIVPPFGRIKTHKKKNAAKKTIFFAKIHQNTAPAGSNLGSLPDDQGDV